MGNISIGERRYVDGGYLSRNPAWHVGDSPWKARQVYKMLVSHAVTPSRVAEVGCGVGEILNQLSRLLPQTTFDGYEISPDATALTESRAHERLHFHCGDFFDTRESFDVVLVMDVIEHIEDYFGFLRKLRGRADRYIFHIPLDMNVSAVLRNRLMDDREEVGHLHYFSKATALASLIETGYEVLDSVYPPAHEVAKGGAIQRAAALVRRVTRNLAPDFTANILGGCTLLVLAR